MSTGLTCESLSYAFGSGPTRQLVFEDLNISIPGKSMTTITGPSGSGKTTLMSLLALVIEPENGRIQLEDEDLTALNGRQRDHFRRQHVGLMFQTSRLIPTLTVKDQIRLVCQVRGNLNHRHGLKLLAHLDMAQHLERFPHELSGGEKQRVALAQCLASGAQLILADEPTASVDSETGHRIVEVIADHISTNGGIAVVSTHDAEVIQASDHTLNLTSGREVGVTRPKEPVA